MQYGASVSVSGNAIIVGAQGANDNNGGAYIYYTNVTSSGINTSYICHNSKI
jgi:hypothetical protein